LAGFAKTYSGRVADGAAYLELGVKGRRGKMLRGVLQLLVQDFVEERNNRLKKYFYDW
jgi:hypothetical protein